MTNVEPIRPGIQVPEREANPDVVALLEEMLTQAKSGELVGFSGAMLYYDGPAARRRAGLASYALIGATQSAVQIMIEEMINR